MGSQNPETNSCTLPVLLTEHCVTVHAVTHQIVATCRRPELTAKANYRDSTSSLRLDWFLYIFSKIPGNNEAIERDWPLWLSQKKSENTKTLVMKCKSYFCLSVSMLNSILVMFQMSTYSVNPVFYSLNVWYIICIIMDAKGIPLWLNKTNTSKRLKRMISWLFTEVLFYYKGKIVNEAVSSWWILSSWQGSRCLSHHLPAPRVSNRRKLEVKVEPGRNRRHSDVVVVKSGQLEN